VANKPRFNLGKFLSGGTETQEPEGTGLQPVLWIPDRDEEDLPEQRKPARSHSRTGTQKTPQSTAQPVAKKPVQPAARSDVQKPVQPAARSEVQKPVQPAARSEVQKPVQPAARPEVHKPVQPAARPEVHKPVQPAARPEVHKPVQPAARPVEQKLVQPAARPVAQKPVQPAVRPEVQKPVQPAAHTAVQKPVQPAACPVAQKPVQPASRPEVEKPVQPAARPVAQKPVQPAARPEVRPPLQTAPQSAARKPEQLRPQPAIQEPEQPRPKRKKGQLILFALLGVVIIPVSLLGTVRLMGDIYQNVGRPKPAVQQKVADMAIFESFDASVSGRILAVRNSMRPADLENRPETPVEETLPPVRKQYWIEEGTLVAPEPNQSLFGRTDDPAKLEQVLQDAQWILDGQTTYFQSDQKLYEDSIVRYYLDDSILAITWQEVHDGSVYTFSEVKVSHPSQFRRHLAGGEYGSDMQYLTTEMAAEVNAVVASAGDFYRFRDFGAVVYQGQARRVEGTYAETCYIDANGDMHFTYGGDVLTVEEVQAFVDERDIQFSLAFGPILVDNYEQVPHTWYGVGEITEEYARAALLQMDTLHYIVVTANTTGHYQEIPTVAQFQKNIAATGCRMAYCLDGGQTATIVMNDELVNRPVYGQQRKISDIIYFATAVPEGGAENG